MRLWVGLLVLVFLRTLLGDAEEKGVIDEFLSAKRRMRTAKKSWSDNTLYDMATDENVFPNLGKLANILLGFDASNAEI